MDQSKNIDDEDNIETLNIRVQKRLTKTENGEIIVEEIPKTVHPINPIFLEHHQSKYSNHEEYPFIKDIIEKNQTIAKVVELSVECMVYETTCKDHSIIEFRQRYTDDEQPGLLLGDVRIRERNFDYAPHYGASVGGWIFAVELPAGTLEKDEAIQPTGVIVGFYPDEKLKCRFHLLAQENGYDNFVEFAEKMHKVLQ